VGLYLTVVTPALLAGPWTVGHGVLTVFHVAVAAGAFRVALTEGEPSWVSMWIPLLSLPFLYWEVALVNQGLVQGYMDPTVVTWEAALFGSPATELAGRYPSTVLSEVLHLAYVSYYPVIMVPPLILFLQRRREAFLTTALGLLSAAVACYAVYVYFPVQGPRYFGPPEGVPSGPVRGLTLAILESGSSRGAAFPSSHMAISAAQAVVMLHALPPVGVVVSIITAGLGFGAVYGGFHYAIDMVVGLVVGVGLAGAVVWHRTRGGPAESEAPAGTDATSPEEDSGA